MRDFKDLKIAVAGTGYVGLSIATLLSQHHKVMAVDIVPEKGIVGGITLNPGSPVEKNDLKLVGDLGFESQPDDFGQVLGYQLTNYVSMSNYTSYEWYFEDEGYYTSLQAQYGEDGKLSTVWLMNNADLRK